MEATNSICKKVLTVEEAAKVLRIGRSSAYAGVRSGEIPSIRIGGSLRIPRAALDRLLDQPDKP
jgi:excisionase family DNA binding protein